MAKKPEVMVNPEKILGDLRYGDLYKPGGGGESAAG